METQTWLSRHYKFILRREYYYTFHLVRGPFTYFSRSCRTPNVELQFVFRRIYIRIPAESEKNLPKRIIWTFPTKGGLGQTTF